MARRCPVCGGVDQHRPDCLYFTRSPESHRGGCGLLLLPYLLLALAAVGIITWLGDWPAVLHQLHQLAHSIAPGIVNP